MSIYRDIVVSVYCDCIFWYCQHYVQLWASMAICGFIRLLNTCTVSHLLWMWYQGIWYLMYTCVCHLFFPPGCPACSKSGRPVCPQAEVSWQGCQGDQIQRGGARGLIWGTGRHLTGTASRMILTSSFWLLAVCDQKLVARRPGKEAVLGHC